MNTKRKESIPKKIFNYISSIISWTVFTLLMICLVFLIYYFVCIKLLASKGDKYEPFFSLYTIISPSMTPNIDVYDVIVNLKVKNPEDIKIGDVITFISKSQECLGATVTHRVVGIESDSKGNISYQTKGDANLISDSALVPYENLIGRVSFKIPKLGRVQFFLASKVGWLLLIFLPSFYIILRALIRAIKKYINFDKYNNKKWYKFLNKPLLTGKKVKLLPAPEIVNEGIKDPIDVGLNNNVSMPEINPSTNINNSVIESNEIVEDDFDDIDLPELKEEKEEEITEDDMPILKKDE